MCSELMEGVSFQGNRVFLWSCKQDGVFSLKKKKNVLGNESDPSLKTRGGYPCSHSYTDHTQNDRRSGVCERVSTHPAVVCDCVRVSVTAAEIHPHFRVQHGLVQTCQLSDIPCHPWAVCLNTSESFLLMQATIKLSNGLNHYVKGGLYCQQFEHCLLPGSTDEMSGAQYFKAINLSAFLFSLIIF